MVIRRKNPDDQRFTYVQLSDEGRLRIIQYREEKKKFISDVLNGFKEEERVQLLDMLTRIQNNIEKI